MRYPSDVYSVFALDIVDSLTQKVFENPSKYKLEIAIREHLEEVKRELLLEGDVKEFTTVLESLPPKSRYELSYIDLSIVNERPLPSLV